MSPRWFVCRVLRQRGRAGAAVDLSSAEPMEGFAPPTSVPFKPALYSLSYTGTTLWRIHHGWSSQRILAITARLQRVTLSDRCTRQKAVPR